MSTPDTLPPITPRTSSKGSSPVSGTAIIKPHERPALISLDIESPLSSPAMEHREKRHKKPSGGSTTSSNKTHSSQGVGYMKKQDRTKTWCPTATEQLTTSKSDEKLETLFERQTTMVNDSTNPGVTPRKHSRTRTDAASQFSKTPSKATTNLSRRSVSTQDLSSTTKRDKNNNVSPRQSKKTKLQRYNSDQKISDISNSSNRRNSNNTRTNSNSNQRRSLGYSSERDTSFSQTRRTSKRETVDSSQMDETADDAGYDSDGDRQDRIIQWLIGVETSGEERPPEPVIVDSGPPQTDTAIHIVYEGKMDKRMDLSQVGLKGKTTKIQ